MDDRERKRYTTKFSARRRILGNDVGTCLASAAQMAATQRLRDRFDESWSNIDEPRTECTHEVSGFCHRPYRLLREYTPCAALDHRRNCYAPRPTRRGPQGRCPAAIHVIQVRLASCLNF